MNRKILFLDLEGTIITSWHDPFVINADKIKRFIVEGNFDEISIFSFAIYHTNDMYTFLTDFDFKKQIERRLSIKLNTDIIPTIEDLKSMFASEYNLPPSKVDIDDFFSFNNKESGFITYCRQSFKDCECTLIDDAIWDEIKMEIPNKNLTIKTVNILSL